MIRADGRTDVSEYRKLWRVALGLAVALTVLVALLGWPGRSWGSGDCGGDGSFAGGNGTVGEPYLIANADQLCAVRNHLDNSNVYFKLENDIDLSGYSNWEPIGSEATPFTGKLDGNGKIISNLTINRGESDFVGLFGVIGEGGEVLNLGLKGVKVTGQNNVGGLVGWNSGNIIGCYIVGEVKSIAEFFGSSGLGGLAGINEGTITDSHAIGIVSGNIDVGGLVGGNSSDIRQSYANVEVSIANPDHSAGSAGGLAGINVGSIEKSYASGKVSGAGTAGGLAGSNVGGIKQSYATGKVSSADGDADAAAGGLAGSNNGEIHNSYSTGKVSGNGSAGGLVGVNSQKIDQSFATGEVSGEGINIGGLVGLNNVGASVAKSYFDMDTTKRTDEGKGEGKSTVDMMQEETFEGWDFNDTWKIKNGETYPLLKWEDYSGFDVALEDAITKPVAGKQFNLSIANAKDDFGLGMIGNRTVKVGSDREATIASVVYNNVSFIDGATTVPITLNTPGEHTLTVQVEGVTNGKTLNIEVSEPILTGIEITKYPEKTEYFVGEALDLTGLVVTGTYSDNSTAVINVNDLEISGFDSSAPAESQTVTVTYQGHTATFTVKIVASTSPDDPGDPGDGGLGTPPTPSVSVTPSRELFIDLNGRYIPPGEIRSAEKRVILQAEPTAGSTVVYLTIPLPILSELAEHNPEQVIELQTPFGSYLLPMALPDLVPEWDALLQKTGQRVNTIGVKLTLDKHPADPRLQELLVNRLPEARLIGEVVEMKLQLVDLATGDALAEIDRFTRPIIQTIRLTPEEHVDLSTLRWGAFRYEEASEVFAYVPARLEERDGQPVAVIASRSNSIYLVVEHEVTFSDMARHWGRDYAERAASRGLVNGVGAGQYAPDRPVTRAEFAAMLVRAAGYVAPEGAEQPYDDVARSAWYYNEVAAAKELGLLAFVGEERLQPNRELTREEMAAMLTALIAREGWPVRTEEIDLQRYRDIGQAEAKYMDAIRTVVALEIMTGTGAERFAPKGVTTRAQAAAVLIRTLDLPGWFD